MGPASCAGQMDCLNKMNALRRQEILAELLISLLSQVAKQPEHSGAIVLAYARKLDELICGCAAAEDLPDAVPNENAEIIRH